MVARRDVGFGANRVMPDNSHIVYRVGIFQGLQAAIPKLGVGGVYEFAVCFPDSFHGHRLLLYLGA